MSNPKTLLRKQRQIRRLRWGVGVTVIGGIVVSIAINVLHAPDNRWARVIAGVPPVAVFAVLELIARVPVGRRGMAAVRVAGSTLVAGGAIYLSYLQQYQAIVSLGFGRDQAKVWPAVIDGLMMVATVTLVQLSHDARAIEDQIDDANEAGPASRRATFDQFEDPKALAYRAAVDDYRAASKAIEDVIVVGPATNGHKPA